jgi:hypothetical protein
MCQEYEYLWDGSDPGWVVCQHDEDREELRVVFAQGQPSLEEIRALRSVISEWRSRSAGEILAALRGQAGLLLGDFESGEAWALRGKCEAAGLRLERRGTHRLSYRFINKRTGRGLMIEDEMIAHAVAKEAIERGLTVSYSTV